MRMDTKVDPSELTSLAASLNDRDSAIRQGLNIQGTRFEVQLEFVSICCHWSTSAEPAHSHQRRFTDTTLHWCMAEPWVGSLSRVKV
jgi:hypothetical protein